jgi:hypothetical protein
MSIQDLRAKVVTQVSHTDDTALLALVADIFEQAAQETTTQVEKEAMLQSALEGEAEIEAGNFGTLADMNTAIRLGIQEGLALRK